MINDLDGLIKIYGENISKAEEFRLEVLEEDPDCEWANEPLCLPTLYKLINEELIELNKEAQKRLLELNDNYFNEG